MYAVFSARGPASGLACRTSSGVSFALGSRLRSWSALRDGQSSAHGSGRPTRRRCRASRPSCGSASMRAPRRLGRSRRRLLPAATSSAPQALRATSRRPDDSSGSSTRRCRPKRPGGPASRCTTPPPRRLRGPAAFPIFLKSASTVLRRSWSRRARWGRSSFASSPSVTATARALPARRRLSSSSRSGASKAHPASPARSPCRPRSCPFRCASASQVVASPRPRAGRGLKTRSTR